MARTLAENDNNSLHPSFDDFDHLGEEVLEATLDSALENDSVLRGILDEGLTQIIRGAIRLFNLQRGRNRGQGRGHREENKEERPASSSCFGEQEDDLLGEEKDLETFLDFALENDTDLREILDEGLTHIIRGAIRLFNLQRQREKGMSQGHRCEKKPAPKILKNVMNVDVGLKNPAVHGDQGFNSKAPDNNPPIVTAAKGLQTFADNTFHSREGPDHQLPMEMETGNEVFSVGWEEAVAKSPQSYSSDHVAAAGTGTECQPEQEPSLPGPAGQLQFNKGPKRTPAQGKRKRNNGLLKHGCYFCQRTFPTPSQLEIHLTSHTQEKPFLCTHCRKEFPRKGDLNVHIRSHMKEKPFKCNLCGKGFTQNTSLEDHIRRHLKEKWFKCPHPGCTFSFVTGAELKQHSRVHSGEKPFACPHPGCGKAFSRNSHLTLHAFVHSGDKPFICNLCGKGACTKQHLEDHIRRHMKEKWFKCPHPGCTSSFVSGSDLKKQPKVHSGEKQFACEYTNANCGKHFTTKNGRDHHHRTHTGEKAFVCGCGKTFATPSNLRSHCKRCEERNRVTKKRKMMSKSCVTLNSIN